MQKEEYSRGTDICCHKEGELYAAEIIHMIRRKMFTGFSHPAAICELFRWSDWQGSQTGEGRRVSER